MGGCNAVDEPQDKQEVELFFAGTLKSDGTMLKHIFMVTVTDLLMAPICGILL